MRLMMSNRTAGQVGSIRKNNIWCLVPGHWLFVNFHHFFFQYSVAHAAKPHLKYAFYRNATAAQYLRCGCYVLTM